MRRADRLFASVVAGVLGGVAIVGAHAEPARLSSRFGPTDSADVSSHIREAAKRYGVPERLILAIIRVESDFNPRAVSPSGARGLMQIMPATAKVFGARDALDPRQNVRAGARYLRGLLDRFDNDLPLVLAAYNAGENAVVRFGGVPPYPETRAFVARVLTLVGHGAEAPAIAVSFSRPQASGTPSGVTYHPRALLEALVGGTPKERVLDVLATEWIASRGRLVKIEGLRIRESRRSVRRTLVEAGEVMLLEAGGVPALHWIVFEDQRLLAAGRADEWPRAVSRYALDLAYVPGGPPTP